MRRAICDLSFASSSTEPWREIVISFTPARCGHMAAASEAACRSVYKASIFRPVMAFLSYMGLSLPEPWEDPCLQMSYRDSHVTGRPPLSPPPRQQEKSSPAHDSDTQSFYSDCNEACDSVGDGGVILTFVTGKI